MEVKIMLDKADALMRKVWNQLEVPCREEGVRRYMVEASTLMSPAKEKKKTAIQKARSCVAEHLKVEEETKRKNIAEEELRKTKESEVRVEDEVDTTLQKTTLVGIPPQSENEEHPPAEASEPPQLAEKEIEPVGRQALENEVSVEKIVEKIAPGHLQETEEEKEEESTSKEDSSLQRPEDNKNACQSVEELDTLRVKGQKWTPPAGKRRCSGNCVGCQKNAKILTFQTVKVATSTG